MNTNEHTRNAADVLRGGTAVTGAMKRTWAVMLHANGEDAFNGHLQRDLTKCRGILLHYCTESHGVAADDHPGLFRFTTEADARGFAMEARRFAPSTVIKAGAP